MSKSKEKGIYLAELSQANCRTLYRDAAKEVTFGLEGESDESLEDMADEWFREIQALQFNTHFRVGIFKNDDTVIGDVALQNIEREQQTASLGITIVKKENRGQGFGQRAIELIMDYGFRTLKLERLWARTLDSNIAAKGCLVKLGFNLDGKEHTECQEHGESQANRLYEILAPEYFFKYSK